MRNAEILQLMDDALTALRASKPVCDAEGARHVAITITMLQQVIAFWRCYVMGDFDGEN